MRRLVTLLTVSVFVCLLVQAIPGTSLAQSGKLAGTVTDGATGDPIPGATVVLEGTQQGTATDATGNYFLIGVQPGTYAVRFSFVGYGTQVIQNVLVTSDRTATLDVALSTAILQGGEVVVVAERPVVDANQTQSRALITSDQIERLPFGSLHEVLARTANSYEGFIRGSRRYETKTILDGVDISDTYERLAPTSSGINLSPGNVYWNINQSRGTNPSLFEINPDAVSEIAVTTGATEARYTSGSGGVVTMALVEGRGPIRGSVSARVAPKYTQPGPDSLDLYGDADKYLAEAQTKRDAAAPEAYLYTWEPDKYAAGDDPEMDIRFNLGGSITSKWGFYATGQYFDTYGWQPNEHRKRVSGQVKTTYSLGQDTRLSAVGVFEDAGLWGGWNNTFYLDPWRFYLEGVAQNDEGSYLASVKLNHSLNRNSFVDFQVYRTYSRSRWGYVDDNGDGFQDLGEEGDFIDLKDPANIEKYIGTGADKSKMFYENISDGFSDTQLFLPEGRRYKSARPQPYSEDATQSTVGIKADYTNQVLLNHFVQAGTELKLRSFDFDEVYGIDQTGSKLNGALEPYAPRAYERSPWELAFYASDRMEYAGLVVNLGMRVELVDRDMEKLVDEFYPFRRDSVQVGDNLLARNFFNREGSVDMDVFLNPSIGVSHPIGTTAAMYFSYARNEQLMPYTTLYALYDGNHSNSRFFNYTDPEMNPIISNNFEVGVQWEFMEGTGFDVNAYMRSIDNYALVGFTAADNAPAGEPILVGNPHTWVTNYGYADSRGLELVLRRRPTLLANDVTVGVTASYTYSTIEQSVGAGANTTGFNAEEGQTEIPFENADHFKHFPQDVRGTNSALTGGYNRRHRALVRSVWQLPVDFSVGLSANVESGFLYPNEVDADPRDRELLTGPTNYSIDVRVEKRFAITDRVGWDLYVDVVNVTDRENIVAYETATPDTRAAFEETGVPGPRLITVDGTSLYGQARTVYFGTRVRF